MAEEMTEEVISGWTIILCVISTTIIWTIVYFLTVMSYPQKSKTWHILAVCLIQGIVSTILSYITQIRKDPWPLNNPGEPSTDGQLLTMVVLLGFFFYETIGWCLDPAYPTLALWAHHIVTILVVADTLYEGYAGAEMCLMIFVGEVTNPPLMVRWFLRDAGYPAPYILVAQYIFFIPFSYLRAVTASHIFYHVIMNDTFRVLFRINIFLIHLIGLVVLKDQTVVTIKMTKKYIKEQVEKMKSSNNNNL